MNHLYILQSERNGRYYIGSTNNLKRRIREHVSGQTRSLKNLRPLKLVFSQSYGTLLEARKMELHLKHLKNRKIIQMIVLDQEIKTRL